MKRGVLLQKLKTVFLKYFKLPPKRVIITYAVAGGILLAIFIALYAAFGKELGDFVSDTERFTHWLDTYQNLGAVIFVFIRAFQTVIKIIPAEPLEIAAGYAFGTWGGLALCSLGSFIGSLVIVALSARFGSKFISAFINEEQLKGLKLISQKKNQRLFLFIFYLIPSTPKDLMTYVAGSLKINMAEFFIITTIARIPSILTSTVCGSQLEQENIKTAVIIFIATAAVSAVCGILYGKYKKSQKNVGIA